MVIVRTACQNDLNDKRERNWEDEVILFLDENYEDWKNPSRTFMVPCEFTYKRSKQNDGEEAEKEFFYLLQKFGESRSEPMFVIHSHKFAEVVSDSELNEESTDVESADEESIDEESTEEKARFWLMGEHDFVVIHRKWGIMFFQVKAGSKLKKKYHAALDQVEKDKRSLQQYAAKNFLSQMRQALNSMLHKGAGFVVMPNCSYQSVRKAGQVKASSGVFKEDCENVDAFSKWWNDKVANVGRNIDKELFEMLVMQ